MSATDSPANYPQPIPIAGGYAIAHPPGEPYRILLVRPINDRSAVEDWCLPGSLYTAQHRNPLEAATAKLAQKTGCQPIGDLQPFLADLRKGNFGSYCGYQTDACLNFIVAGPVRGTPAPNRDLWTRDARFFDIGEIEKLTLGRGHALVIDSWVNALARRDTSTFRFLRQQTARMPFPRNRKSSERQLALQLQYPEPIPIMTSTWIAHEYNNPYRVLFVSKKNDPLSLLYLPGGIFEWIRHFDLLETGIHELDEESGLKAVGDPFPLFFDLRTGRDSRMWCSKRTDHCLDLIMACSVRGKIRPKDAEEVRRAEFLDIRSLKPTMLGYGHMRTIDRWMQLIASSGPLKFDFILS